MAASSNGISLPVRDIILNTRRDSPNLRATMHYFVYYKNILLKRVSQRYPTSFRRFPKILQKLSEGHTKHLIHFPIIYEYCRRIPKIAENVSIITSLNTI